MEGRSESVLHLPAHALIRESWARCRAAGMDPEARALHCVPDVELRRRRSAAAEWLPLVREHADWISATLTTPHVVCVADHDGVLLHATGLDRDTLREQGLAPGFDWSEARASTNCIGTVLRAGVPLVLTREDHYRRALRGYECAAAPLRDHAGVLLGVLGLLSTSPGHLDSHYAMVIYAARAVERELAAVAHLRTALASSSAETERAQREVLVREEQFRTLADSIPHLAWMADREGWIFWYNRRWYEYTGMSLSEAQGWGWRRVQHPDYAADVEQRVRNAWQAGEEWEDVFPLRGADGEYRWFLSRALPIRDREGRIVRWFGTNTDVTPQIETEQALREAQAKLQRLYEQAQGSLRERDEVVAMVSHDLRAPLNVLTMASHLLLEPRVTGEQKKSQAEVVARVVAQMSRLVTDLLDLTRARAGRLTLDARPVAPDALLRAAHQAADPLARAAGVELLLEGDVPTPLPPVLADDTRIQQVFSNLISNALEHTPAGGRIVLRAAPASEAGSAGEAVVGDAAGTAQTSPEADAFVCFQVIDNGSGIRVDDLPRVFERFWQGRGAQRTGAGLGLSICKGVVEAHGGAIWATSEPGQGATFAFTLPVAPGA